MPNLRYQNYVTPRYSNKHRMGLIVPSLNVTIEPEFNAIAPPDISIHVTRLKLERGDAESLEKMAKKTEEACDLLASANVDVVVYACTTGSLVKGLDWESDLVKRMKTRIKAEVTTTARAVVDSLKEMKLGAISIGTPYTKELNRIEKEFIESNGIKVVKIKGLGCVSGEDLHKYDPKRTMELASSVDSINSDGIFLSCTDLKTVTVIEQLEKKLKKPVISSNTATLWKALRVMKYKNAKIMKCGTLLRQIS
jgi:maleate isomerase